MADQYDQRADLRVIMAKILTFDLENSRFGVWVWGPRRLLRGFQFSPPSRKIAAWAVAVGLFSQTRGLSDLSLFFPFFFFLRDFTTSVGVSKDLVHELPRSPFSDIFLARCNPITP